MKYDLFIKEKVLEAIVTLYQVKPNVDHVQVQHTRKEHKGDYTIVAFPIVKYSKKSPEQTAEEIGSFLQKHIVDIGGYNVIKGFLNLELKQDYWISEFKKAYLESEFGIIKANAESKKVVVEYSSPNTNKPLHLGHIRNNLIGYSISKILAATGKNVIKTNIVNDRGIHICKSMIAWQKWGNNETPESSGLKGDFLVGKYYVRFDQEYKKEIEQLVSKGMTRPEAEKNAPLMEETREMLQKWEANEQKTMDLWETMNTWVYAGFDVTYKKLGVDFDKIYYESDTYKLGKSIVLDGVKQNKLELREDSSVWADLEKEGLDHKLLLRSDGTSVYMTQDLGTAYIRYKDFKFDQQIYVVGNEQDHHFKVLKIILEKLGFEWGRHMYHLSYGMVELPEGKMKSREGTVVDADELIDEMQSTALKISEELGKLDSLEQEEKIKTIETIALGALKYFLLKVDPKKNMTFNPRESIDFNGNTGPFIQYTYARIQSVKTKAHDQLIRYSEPVDSLIIDEKEVQLIKLIKLFPEVIAESAEILNPAIVANYIYELVKEFNQFYHDFPILKEQNENLVKFRLQLSDLTGRVIRNAMGLLGIGVPERM